MCNCQICQDSTHFRQELAKLPVEHQPIFQNMYDGLLDSEMDRDYYGAVLDGSWPGSREILERFHGMPVSAARFLSGQQPFSAALDAAVDPLPAESQPYFRALVQRVIGTAEERVTLGNIVRNAVPDATTRLADYRHARASA